MQNAPKQVIVMRKDLNMRKGKMVAQGAHASMKVILDRMSEIEIYKGGVVFGMQTSMPNAMKQWIEGLFTKVCVS